MTKALAVAALICVIESFGTGSPSARKFAPHQEPRGIGNLVARSDRVTPVYHAGTKLAFGDNLLSDPRKAGKVNLVVSAGGKS